MSARPLERGARSDVRATPRVRGPAPIGHPYRVDYDAASALWREGQSRLHAAEPHERAAMERVIDEIVSELRRRLGGAFTRQELASLYAEQGTDWCFDIATRVAPSTPAAWDMTTVAGAAFGRYARQASDYRPPEREVARPPGMEPD